MIDGLSRRQLIVLVPSIIGVFSGCVPESGSQANLSTDSLNVSETDGSYTIEVVPEVGGRGDWEPFRNVSVLVKTETGNVTCRHAIGDLTEIGEHEPVTFTCDEFPHTITYEVDRELCNDEVGVSKRVYVDERDWWTEEFVSCE